MTMRRVLIGAAALALAACGEGTPEEAPDGSQFTLQETPNLPADPDGVVRLRGDGLEVTGPLGTALAFGSPREAVEAELAKVFEGARDAGTNSECGAGPIAFTEYPGGLALNFQEGKLVGWSLRDDQTMGDGADIATAEGIALDSSEAELAEAYEVEMIADSTLGEEFTTPAGIFGFLTGTAAERQVESLHAGTNCFFR